MRQRAVRRWVGWVAIGFFSCVMCGDVAAQTPSAGPLTLNDAIQLALKNYPAIKESRARAQAAEEGVGVARTAYLPRLDMMWQENRATTNNVFGLLFPQSTLFSMSGPVLGTRSLGESGSAAECRHVSGGPMASQTSTALSARASDQHRHDHGADIRDSRE